jgi:hypothetical protein
MENAFTMTTFSPNISGSSQALLKIFWFITINPEFVDIFPVK